MVRFYWHISPPALSPLKRRKPYPNHVLSPVDSHLWCSARFYSRALLFSICTTPLSSLVKASSADHHLYAEDTQLFISLSDSVDHFLHVVTQISTWMTSNLLCLNPFKTEFILIRLRDQLKNPRPSFPTTLILHPPTNSLQILLSAT